MQRFIILFVTLLAACSTTQVTQETVPRFQAQHHPVYGTAGMVVAQERVAAEIGAKVLADGGNAVDAAVAVGFSMAVTLPRAGNIGGGGFMLAYDADSGDTTAIDYREMAPLAATRDMFLDENGDADPEVSRYSHKAAGVPGTVAGLFLAHQRFGRLPWKRLVEPAVKLARDGITVSYDQATLLQARKERMCADEATCGYFYKANGEPYAFGERLVQSDLATTLQLIADNGPDAFYRGRIADMIVAEMEAGGGLVDKASLAAYKPIVREPLRGSYRGYEIVSMPPPSSGGVHVIQMLNVLEKFPVSELGVGSADGVHLLAETMRLAFADRSKHLGDPAYYEVPVDWLTSEDYAAQLARGINMNKARPSSDVLPGVAPAFESQDTTHFSIMDADGNVVSNTYTLNLTYGSGISVSGAGFLLNDEMDDFVSKPGVPNAFGLLGAEANEVDSGKRPLSSMTPTIVFADGEPWFAAGSPGGAYIITSVLQTIVNMIDHGMNIADAVNQPRMHHQWYPDKLLLESGFSPDTVRLLEDRGHVVVSSHSPIGSVQAVAWKDGVYRGAADPRRQNAASAAPAAVDATAK
ncbi:MAG: gamma-glutamyltransferase [Desulfobulbaceae bacterium]|nr:gamma-glutamyltransferase [Desulfobulbaceae bacterium]